MKKRILSFITASLLTQLSFGQQTPVSSLAGNSSAAYWSRGGNNQTNLANILGTKWNSPIYFITGG